MTTITLFTQRVCNAGVFTTKRAQGLRVNHRLGGMGRGHSYTLLSKGSIAEVALCTHVHDAHIHSVLKQETPGAEARGPYTVLTASLEQPVVHHRRSDSSLN